ncbi:MAG: transglycosylase SLT domain-containing protein [Bacteriovoracaceae bacterium]|nr:transglycosylase SLT domain-containing protein [Bacteriovoracaceae bacterium]
MFHKTLRFSLMLTLFASCATREVAQVETTEVVKVSRIQKDLIEKDLNFCDTCVIGSVGDEVLKSSDKKTYYLHGAEHLNLDNFYFDIPVVYNKAVKKWIRYFTGRGKATYRKYAERAGRYGPVLSKILNDQGLPRDLIFLSMAESGFANHARSWAKAVGPWQFMPFTGRRYGLEVGFFLDERRDPLKATVAASTYLRDLYDRFGSWELAMAGYNAGEGKIGRAIRRYRTKNFWKIRKGRYLKPETKNYVPKIMALAIIGKNLKAFGFENVEFKKALDFQEIEVPGNTDLYKVAQVIGSDFKEMKKYNPEVLRWQTPPSKKTYVLRVPVGKKQAWSDLEDKSVVAATDYKVYQLRGYASLHHVGRKFKVPSKVLAQINDMDPKKRLFPKTAVYLPFRDDHKPRKDRLYSDLYEKPRKSVLRRRAYNRWIKRGRSRGAKIENPKQFYIVKKGDTLWDIARKTGVNINTIIRSNYSLVKRRMILPGDKLAIK